LTGQGSGGGVQVSGHGMSSNIMTSQNPEMQNIIRY